jgi:hypothetical protein
MVNYRRSCFLAGFTLVCVLAPAQRQPAKQYVVAGFADGAACHRLPVPQFTILPSGDRSDTGDRLAVKCIPGLLSLTFTIDTKVPSALDQNVYTFRWGASKESGHTFPEGQFTYNEKLCAYLADLFYSTFPNVATSSSEAALEPMHWSATCNPDDQWGTSMEIELSPHAELRHPRTPSRQLRIRCSLRVSWEWNFHSGDR